MKKYITLVSITFVVVFSLIFVPIIVNGFLPKASLTKLSNTYYTDYIYASGIVESQEKKEVVLDLPIIPKKVNYKVGDKVKAGDVIAVVDSEATIMALANLSQSIPKEFLANIPEQAIEIFSTLGSELNLLQMAFPKEITAPTSGIISGMNLVSGTMTVPKIPAVSISNNDKLQIKVSINESNINKIQQGMLVAISGDALVKSYMGKVVMIYPEARTQFSGTTKETVVDIIVELDEQSNKLKAGYNIYAKIETEPAKNINIIPYECVGQDDDGKEYIYIYDKGKAHKKYIEFGKETPEGVEVISGVNEKDNLIFNASLIKKDGAYVNARGR